MGRLEKSIEIKAPPEKIWEMLALDRTKEWEEGWNKNLKSLKFTSEINTPEDKYRLGTTAHINMKQLGELDFEITESLKNERITYQASKYMLQYYLEPIYEGTKLTYVVDYHVPGGILGKTLDKLTYRIGEKTAERSLETLKSILEK